MTPETRRQIFRYGIAIDLVIVAVGAGMLLPPAPLVLLSLFAAAVLLSAWKGGWQGGLTALVLSVVALAAMFSFGVQPLLLFALAMTVGGAAVIAASGVRRQSPPLSNSVALRTEALEYESGGDSLRTPNSGERTADPSAAELEAQLAREREEVERERARLEQERLRAERELEERLAHEREEAERARLEAEREAAERERARLEAERLRAERELEERLAREREEAERERARLEAEREAAEREKARLEEERLRTERELEERLAREREEVERERARLEAEREAAEREKARLEEERLRTERELEERLAREREDAERERRELEARAAREREEAEREKARLEEERLRLAAEREAAERARREVEEAAAREREEAERTLQARLEEEREAMRLRLEEQLAAEREAIAKEAEARIEEAKRVAESTATRAAAPKPAVPAAPKPSLFDTISGWFHREPRRRPNLTTKRIATNGTATRRPAAPPARRTTPVPQTQPQKPRTPRLVLLERRRATADTVLPKLRQRGVEVTVVERWVDAVDELLRVRPDAFLIDVEHPDFDKAHRTTMEKSANLPIVLTGRSPAAAPPNVAYASFAVRPYDSEELARIAHQAMARPDELLAMQMIQRTPAHPPPAPPRPAPPALVKRAEPQQPQIIVATKPASNEEYEVQCFTCRVSFNAVESDWCSCLTKERTLVCTNCLTCFCKAPPAYKEKFWVEAPPRLFERKTAEARRQGVLAANASPATVARPLVLTVEDDEEIQAIVQRVCANLGYGFIYAMNGQDGLELAHEYKPNLILSDAFMPKLDGREMCRMLKDDPAFADTRMVVMTGLYTDTKYRSEALKRFHVDDYIAKPVAITDLINLLQKHLEGVSGLPVQDDLHELHRQDLVGEVEDVPLSEMLAAPDSPQMPIAAAAAPAPARPDAYDVCCFNCEQTFDAAHGEWCRCVGRDNTLVCAHCGGCFCKAPAAYKERFWSDAPPSLFERKMIGSKRSLGARANPPATDVKRPLILLVEDDENVQLIVRTVVTTMGFGFVVGANGQEGLSLAREYGPDLILSDAFMPKLDGREMCRLLKEDPTTARSKAIIMTGLYTDRKYRHEALDYFKVDDYVAKPLAVDDLIKLFKKHLPQEVATAH